MRFFRWAWDLFVGTTGVIGIAGTPDDVGNWVGFLSELSRHADTTQVRFLSVVLLALLILNFIERFNKWNENLPGINTPRYLNFYKFPLRRIKWDFDNCVSMGTKGGKGPIITIFQAGIMVSWGNGINPKKAIIKSLNKGIELELVIESDPQYKPASEMTLIPKANQYWRIIGIFEPREMEAADFLTEFPGFDFIFEYNNTSFKKRFSRNELKLMIDRCREYANPPRIPQPY